MRRIFLTVCASVLCGLLAFHGVLAQEEERGSEPYAFEVEAINEGLEPMDPPLRLDTPRAAMESFLDAIRRGEADRAAHALNLNAIDRQRQAARAPDLALMLAFLLHRHNLIDWSELSDSPDARVLPRAQQPGGPYSRRSVLLGEVDLDGRPVPVSLQRFQAGDASPIWLFSPFAVERIPDLYRNSRPGLLSEWVPLRERVELFGRPSPYEWLAVAGLLAACILLWLMIYFLARALTRRMASRPRREAARIALPLATVAAALVFRFGADGLFLLTGPVASNLHIGAEVVALIAGAWLLLRLVSNVTLALSERYVVPLASDDPENRRTKTTVYVVRRLALVVIALLSIGYILLRLGLFESFGLSVLASAGALGVLVAIAARPLLGNMVAGLQIALTDPVRIGDVVVYGDHWATVEDISFAHTVLRTWTDTRLIVPHSDFLSRSFENWSKDGEAIRRIVKIPVDFRIDVDQVRRQAEAIVEGDPRWTGEHPLVEMVEVNGETAILWIWVSGTTSFTSWYLHNDVREKLIAFLRELDGGAYLPRKRHVLVADGPGPPDGNEEPLSPRRASAGSARRGNRLTAG